MCGRYATTRARQELLDQFAIQADETGGGLEPDYNVAPTDPVPAVLIRRPGGEAEEEAEAVRQLRMLRWGLVPSWAKDVSVGARMINARVETVAEKPAYRRAFARRRCLLPADGYYEWYTLQDDPATDEKGRKRKPRKQPFYIHPKDGGVMAMAGLYELWRSPDGEWLWSCTLITTDAPDDLGRIHDRMPMVVTPDRWDAWLDPDLTAPEEIRGLLTPAMAGTMDAYPVATLVGNVRNNGPRLIEPLADGDIQGSTSGTLF
ncbi:SOS response-associated peptidase [Actinomadura logoneensis]|uniref:Abasic site processing protein n=1 Tax=Actinomadura logoneensis TaxID=2293572 RepID=A0A372JEN8_9ACTN|nr:SOS response-associated peptidase [Actinomadura logoneensis]RFU38442.1 SOS response-associated peptidase [Actinomadura logoneensis]